MYKVGDKVRVKINGIGYRTGIITRPALNSFWVLYNGEEYLVAVKFLNEWRKKK